MKPLDVRLLRHARAARGVLGYGALLGFARTLAIIVWSWCLGNALATVALPVLGGLGGASGRVAEDARPETDVPWLLAGALVALCVRSIASWGMELLAARGAIQVKAQLRSAALDAVDVRSPERGNGVAAVIPATVLGRGLDALDGFFSGYLPQLILTAVATPLLVLAVLIADPVSGATVLIVFPVIPLFMILIGMATQAVQDRQWIQLQRLSTAFLDVVEGLPTLKIFRREQRQVSRIARETEEYRSRTMQVLRVTFLSGFVLDLAGTFSIALVAVTVGTRLVDGEFPLALGLFVLLLLPEVFVPIRQVGAAYHASTEGLSASQDIFDLIEGAEEDDAAPDGTTDGADELRLEQLRVLRGADTVIGPVDFRVRPGEFVALTGPSGAGKSTILGVLLGFLPSASGSMHRPQQLAWSGQQPGLLQGSVRENIALGASTIDDMLVDQVLRAVGLSEIDPKLQLGSLGSGLSGGQAQRVAIARCLYRARQLDVGAILLDEPTSALDRRSEKLVCEVLQAEARSGRAVLVVSHRHGVLQAADRIVTLDATDSQQFTTEGSAA